MQLTYRNEPDVAFPGMLADSMFKRTVSRAVGSETPILPGVFVAEDVDGKVFPMGTADTVYSGVAQHDHTLVGRPNILAGGAVGTNRVTPVWQQTEPMSVLQRGAIWVLLATGATLTNNQPVSVLTSGAQTGYAIQGGAANSSVVPNAQTRSKPFTLADGRRIIQVELHAGNA